MIETERLRLREWQDADLEPFARMSADPVVMADFPAMLDRDETAAAIARYRQRWAEDGFFFAAIEQKSDGMFLGIAGLLTMNAKMPFPGTVEIGWRLDAPYWGQGYAGEAARAWLAYGFETLDLPEIVAITTRGNHRSLALMQRLGMVRDAARDFDHPGVPEGHRLRPHVLYALSRDAYFAAR